MVPNHSTERYVRLLGQPLPQEVESVVGDSTTLLSRFAWTANGVRGVLVRRPVDPGSSPDTVPIRHPVMGEGLARDHRLPVATLSTALVSEAQTRCALPRSVDPHFVLLVLS